MGQVKKIVLVNFSHLWGGGEVQHFELAIEFIKQGHAVHLLVKKGSSLQKKALNQRIPHTPLSVNKYSFLSPLKILKIKHFIKLQKPDAIILNSSPELKLFALSTSFKKNKLIYRRGYHAAIKPSLLNRYLFNNLSYVVANSNFIKSKTLLKISKYCRNEPIVIHNGIDALPANIKNTANGLTILAMGRLVKYKQFDLLILAMRSVLKKVPDAILWIVGEGPEKQELETLITKHNLQHSVKLLGYREDITMIISQSSILVHPASSEAFGVVFLEAMRQSLPCIAFKGHAADEIIEHNKTGLLIEAMNQNSISEGIVSLLTNREKQIELGNNGQKRFNEHFTISVSVKKFLEII